MCLQGSQTGSGFNHHIDLQFEWCGVHVSTFLRKPAWFKWALVSFTNVMQGTTGYCHDEHRSFNKHLASITSSGPSPDQMPDPLPSLFWLGCSWNCVCMQVNQPQHFMHVDERGESRLCNNKWLHIHSSNCPWRMCKPFVIVNCSKHYTVAISIEITYRTRPTGINIGKICLHPRRLAQ